MLPYLIAGAIGFGIGKLFENGGETFMAGGRITTNEGIIESFLNSNREVRVGNLESVEMDDIMYLRNYRTFIAKRMGNKVKISSQKYSQTTSTITNRLKALAEKMGYSVEYVIEKEIYNFDEFVGGGEIKLKIKNVDSFDKHYDEVGFTKKELSLPKQDSNKVWFTTTNDKSIAEQLISDGLVEKYAEGGSIKYVKGGMLGESARLEYITDAYASFELRDKLKEALGLESEDEKLGDKVVISFAYTDYGGDFLDKVAIEYFQENYPENTLVEATGWGGQNAYVFGEPAKEWIETTEDYALGFEDIEDFYYEKQNEQEAEDFNYFLDEITDEYNFDREEAFDWLIENKGGYYGMTTQGLDFSYEDLTNELVLEGIIEPKEEDEDEYEGGGEAEKKYILRRGTPIRKNIRKKRPKTRNPKMVRTIFEEEYFKDFDNGGEAEEKYILRRGTPIRKYVRAYYNETISNDDNGYQVNLMFYNNQDDDDYFDEEFITTNSPEEAEELADKINEVGHEGFMPKPFTIRRGNKYTGGGEAKKRRRSASAQYGRSDRSFDKQLTAKPVGYRFSNAKANQLRKDPFAKPTEAQVKKYLGKGIYKENRRNRSDRDRNAKL